MAYNGRDDQQECVSNSFCVPNGKKEKCMSASKPIHPNHDHQHGADCGHTAVKHGDHVDYLHDGHLHHVGDKGVECHQLDVSGANPADCTPQHQCGGHEATHKHGPGCGHEAVPHGGHTD